MSSRVQQVLKNLCCNNGWSYGVFWRFNPRNPRLLALEDAYFEKQMGMVINDMLQHVQMLGGRIIGQGVFRGKHKWIFSDTYGGQWSPTASVDNQDFFQDNSEFHRQFSSGIKTIALISVAPQGVVQFGSTRKIAESLDFVDCIRSIIQHLVSVNGMVLENVPTASTREIFDPSGTESSMFSSGSSCSNHRSNKPMYDGRGKELMGKIPSAVEIPQPSPIGSQNASPRPLMSYSFQLKNQFQTAGAEAQVILATPNMGMPQGLSQFTNSVVNNSATRNPMINTWSTEGSSMTSFEQQILSGIGMQEFPSTLSANSHTPISCRNASQNFQGHTGLTSCGTSILSNTVTKTTQMEVNKPGGYNSGKLDVYQLSGIEGEIAQGSTSFCTIPEESKLPSDNTAISKPNAVDNSSRWVAQSVEQGDVGFVASLDKSLSQTLGIASTSSGLIGDEVFRGIPVNNAVNFVQDPLVDNMNPINAFYDGNERSLNPPVQLNVENNLFGSFGLDFGKIHGTESWDDIINQAGSGSHKNLSTGASECISELDIGSMSGSQKGFFADFGLEQLLESAFSNSNSDTRPSTDDQLSTTTIGRAGSVPEYSNQVQLTGLSCLDGTMHEPIPECKLENTMHINKKESGSKSRVSSWIDDSYSINSASAAVTNPKRLEEPARATKKRAKLGESTRPRPKDRQQIQDRVKELREIVPNGAKCSIDALLYRTIKSMLFMRSVAKYADKLKQADEPKMVGNENGVILKDNSNGGGATWAFEVGCQTMVCPILVEDVNPPGLMLIEMLCEERGYFLEIADIIRGFGLTILKGLMEVQEDKIWARFTVEANRDNITRMDIFLSLVQLLQQTTTGISSSSQPTKGIDGGVPVCTTYQQSPMLIPVADQLH